MSEKPVGMYYTPEALAEIADLRRQLAEAQAACAAAERLWGRDVKKAVLAQLQRHAKEFLDRLATAEAIVEKLPKTADGVPVFLHDEVWLPGEDEPLYVGHIENSTRQGWWYAQRPYRAALDLCMCYSTREAAQVAKEAKQ